MNNSWKNWAIALLLLLNCILIFTLVFRRPSHPPRLAKELSLSKEKAKAVEILEDPFLLQRKKQKETFRNIEHRLISAALIGDTLQVAANSNALLKAKQQEVLQMITYFKQLGDLLNKTEKKEVLHISGNFDRKPRH